MAIRKRSAPGTIIATDFAEIEARVVAHHSDNVIMADPISRAEDHRGTFDPKDDAFPGSVADAMSGSNRASAGTVMRHIAYTQPGNVPLPNDMRVQDLLAQVRLPLNERDGTEASYRNRVRSPLTGIRGFCVECKGGSPKAVKECAQMECVLWTQRMGKNTLRGRSG